jgi:hypothetical protein
MIFYGDWASHRLQYEIGRIQPNFATFRSIETGIYIADDLKRAVESIRSGTLNV